MKVFLKKTILFGILSSIKYQFKIAKLRAVFYKKYENKNQLVPHNVFPIEVIDAGQGSYGELNIVTFGKDYKLKIGDYVSIAQDVTFILQAEHYINHISTYPFRAKILKEREPEAFAKGDIIVEDDVWIGYGATIMSGVKIGKGAVVAAGSVVTKEVPPYAVVGGTPAKIIKYRFSVSLITELMKIDYSNITEDMVSGHIKDLYTDLKDVEQLSWIPNKQ